MPILLFLLRKGIYVERIVTFSQNLALLKTIDPTEKCVCISLIFNNI